MTGPTENESWLIETGDAVIHKKSRVGIEGLLPWELLVYCLWLADYGMRNGGDLELAAEFYPEFYSRGRKLAGELSLPLTLAFLSLPKDDAEDSYLDSFESICGEIRGARPDAAVEGRIRRRTRRG